MIDEKKLIDEIKEYIDEYADLDENGHHNFKWCAMMEVLYIIERQPKEGEWIPCDERLPVALRNVLVSYETETYGRKHVVVAFYDRGEWWKLGRTLEIITGKVTAWQPLPEPWKEQEK